MPLKESEDVLGGNYKLQYLKHDRAPDEQAPGGKGNNDGK